MMKCQLCPLAGRDKDCLAITARNPRLCELIDPSCPQYHPGYVAIVSEGAAIAPAPVTPNPHHERLMLVWGCDYRSDLDECGCTRRSHCALRKGFFEREPFAVTLAECFQCVSDHAT